MATTNYAKQIAAHDILTGICAAVLVACVAVVFISVARSPVPGYEAVWFDAVLRRFASIGVTSVLSLAGIISLRLRRRQLKEAMEQADAERRYKV